MKKRSMRQHSFVILIVTTAVLFLGTTTLYAQQQVLSKKEAIRIALENNYSITIAENNVAIAENEAGILNSGYLPQIFGLAGASYRNTDLSTSFEGTDQDGNPLPDRIINDAETQSYNASINLDYTLFDGLGRFYNYKRLKESYSLSQLEARETIELSLLQLFSVYYEVARITENVEVLKDILAISQDRVTRTEYQFDYGQTTGLEVLNAKVDVTNDSINLMNARQRLENTKRDLDVVMARNLETNFTVDTLVEFIPELLIESYLREVDTNNVRLLQAESNILLSDYDVKTARAGYLPTVGLTGFYGWNENRNPPSAFFGGNIQDNTSFGAQINLRWNLFDGGGTITRTQSAKIARENQEIFKEQIRLEVNRDIANALGNYENLLNVFQIQEQNVITNENNFERSRERFSLGQITSIEFRQAQINLANAKTNKNLAKYDAKLAELQLLQLVGQLLNIDF